MPDIRYLQTDFDSDYLRQGEGGPRSTRHRPHQGHPYCGAQLQNEVQPVHRRFDTLINFVLTDSLEFERKIVDEDDSVAMAQLKKSGRKNSEKVWVHVIDTIFTPKKLTAEQVRNLRYVPGTNNQTEFELEAGLVTTESKVVIPVVECRIPYKMFLDTVRFRQEVINLVDDQENNFSNYGGIKFGSMEKGNNEAGNWGDE